MSFENPIYKKMTYCNPLAIPQCPKGEDGGWSAMEYTNEPQADYRSISDPSVLYYDNKWYLYPSYGMAFVSEDFVTWKHEPVEPYNLKYSPSVIPHRGKFLLTGHSQGLYIGDSPVGHFDYIGEFITADGKVYAPHDGSAFQPLDSALFQDDDGKIYLYWFDNRFDVENNVYVCETWGVELDGDNPNHFCTEPYLINEFNGDNYWERNGQYNQNTKFGWVEGQWMFKHNGRYYMIYSSPGTTYKSYCMAAYYSDEGPLTGFVLQKNNPVTLSNSPLISGAGHGSIAPGPNGTLWAFYTIAMCGVHPYERRIGMDPIGIDENGELYCPKISDVPSFGALDKEFNLENNSAGLLPLTFMLRHHVKASSWAPGRGVMYAFDESLLSWWQPAEDDKEPTICVDLDGGYVCEALRIIWRDVNIDYANGVLPGPYKYVLEGRERVGEGEFKTILDMSENETDYIIDYRTFKPVVCGEMRLRIVGWPKGITPSIISFTVFGTKY